MEKVSKFLCCLFAFMLFVLIAYMMINVFHDQSNKMYYIEKVNVKSVENKEDIIYKKFVEDKKGLSDKHFYVILVCDGCDKYGPRYRRFYTMNYKISEGILSLPEEHIIIKDNYTVQEITFKEYFKYNMKNLKQKYLK